MTTSIDHLLAAVYRQALQDIRDILAGLDDETALAALQVAADALTEEGL